ncbi:hypothetical protein KCP73_20380 [Salmonella enterica subsp. enterica]|nr:hypothetical protein KCP73_20380 [Salmonella enterica subsp. enterica]
MARAAGLSATLRHIPIAPHKGWRPTCLDVFIDKRVAIIGAGPAGLPALTCWRAMAFRHRLRSPSGNKSAVCSPCAIPASSNWINRAPSKFEAMGIRLSLTAKWGKIFPETRCWRVMTPSCRGRDPPPKGRFTE